MGSEGPTWSTRTTDRPKARAYRTGSPVIRCAGRGRADRGHRGADPAALLPQTGRGVAVRPGRGGRRGAATFAIAAHADEREAHVREVERSGRSLPEGSYGRRNRQAIAARETQVAARLRAVEQAYRTAIERGTAAKPKEPPGPPGPPTVPDRPRRQGSRRDSTARRIIGVARWIDRLTRCPWP
jgi:hypothetical protein